MKFRLSALVVFSSGLAFLTATSGRFEWMSFLALAIGGFLTSGGANGLNEVFEKDYDKMMVRTANRPMPSGRMSVTEGLLASGIMSVGGISLLWSYFGPNTALISAVSLLIYAFLYTPLKRVSEVAVFVGAIPGAMPPLIGWVAATGQIGWMGWVLFGIQFIWQFPHFWAIGWMSYDDYKNAGYKLLPANVARTRFSALQNIVFILALMGIALVPFIKGFQHVIPASIILIAGIAFLWKAIQLYNKRTVAAARTLMFASIIYLPVVQLAMWLGKFLN